jgi:uncharacterized protein
MTTVVYGDFEWDDAKEAANRAKHGVSFVEAATAIVDPDAVFFSDDSTGEQRFIAIGMSALGRVLACIHVQRGERDRIISARRANASEEADYAEGE